MKHLFIINPMCTGMKGQAGAMAEEIRAVMQNHPSLSYDIHITRWHRDALGFCRKYVLRENGGMVRIHILGGTGTLFEIVNAVIDLPHVQIASYPMGKTNVFLHYFGKKNMPVFRSIDKQVLSDAIPVDALRCNHDYGVSSILTGLEAYVDNVGDQLIEKTHLPNDLCYFLVAARRLLQKKLSQRYRISIDGQVLDGDYLSILAANHPWYSANMYPAVDARPDSGVMDVYLIKDSPVHVRLRLLPQYVYGQYRKYPEYFLHYACRKVLISSEEIMWLSVDGETFYGNKFEYELLPGAIQFVYPLEGSVEKESAGR